MLAAQLQEAVDAVCPGTNVRIGRRDNRSTWDLDLSSCSGTEEQIAAAWNVLATFDDSDSAAAAWEVQQRRKEVLHLLMSNEPTMIGIRALGMISLAGITEAKQGVTQTKTWQECLDAFEHIIMTGRAEVA